MKKEKTFIEKFFEEHGPFKFYNSNTPPKPVPLPYDMILEAISGSLITNREIKMNIDLRKYKSNAAVVRVFLENNKDKNLSDKLTNLSMYTHMPLIVCAYFIAKFEGPSPDILSKIESLKLFYKYDQIVGVDELMDF